MTYFVATFVAALGLGPVGVHPPLCHRTKHTHLWSLSIFKFWPGPADSTKNTSVYNFAGQVVPRCRLLRPQTTFCRAVQAHL